MYGPGSLDKVFANMYGFHQKRQEDDSPAGQDDTDNGLALQGNDTQRVCICESSFWDQIAGCVACYAKHGSLELEGTLPESVLQSASSTYCAATATASVGLAEFLYSMAIGVTPSATPTATGDGSSSVKYADPIGNKTEVSYYYTQAVTGTAAWSVPHATGTSGSISFTTTNIQDGQIRPTASVSGIALNATGTQSGNSNGAGRYEAVGTLGIFGLAGLLAFL